MNKSEPRSLNVIRKEMIKLIDIRDTEEAHVLADGLLIEAIRKLCPEAEDLIHSYQRIKKWYA